MGNLPKPPTELKIKKEWEAGFRGVQRKSVSLNKTEGYGGAEESEALARPGRTELRLFEQHMGQAGAKAKQRKHRASVEQTLRQLQGNEMGKSEKEDPKEGPSMGKPSFLGTHTIYAKPGESFSGGPAKSPEELKEKLGKFSPTREEMGKAIPKKSKKSKKKTDRDREEDRKSALSKLKKVAEHMGMDKGCKAVRLSPDPAAKTARLSPDPAQKAHLGTALIPTEPGKPATWDGKGSRRAGSVVGRPEPAPGHQLARDVDRQETAARGVHQTSFFGPNPARQREVSEGVSKIAQPRAPIQKEPSLKPGSTVTMQSVVSPEEKKTMGKAAPALGSVKKLYLSPGDAPKGKSKEKKSPIQLDTAPQFLEEKKKRSSSMTKSAMLDLMIFKAQSCEQSPANPVNENGPVSGFKHAGKSPARTSVSYDGNEQEPGNPANERMSVSGSAQAGSGPAQTSVSGSSHGGKGPARTSVSYDGNEQEPGNPTQINKARGLDIGLIHKDQAARHVAAMEDHLKQAKAEKDPQWSVEHRKAAVLQLKAHQHHLNVANGVLSGPEHQEKAWELSKRANAASDVANRTASRAAGIVKAQEEDHAGKGPEQTSVSGESHAGKGSKQKDVDGPAAVGCPNEMNKAVTALAVPRLPRAMAMAMDTWRSATRVLTRGNSEISKHFTHHGAGPLFPETSQEIDDEAQKRATRSPDVFKSCEACGRTYRITKSLDEPCPTCVGNTNSCMAKSRGGYLVSSFIKD